MSVEPTPAQLTSWCEQLAAIALEGRTSTQHGYDLERYELVESAVASLRVDGDITRWRAVVEACAKTGWALTPGDDDRLRYERLSEIAVDMGNGSGFFGPPSLPRTTDDQSLPAISARYVTPRVGISAAVDDTHGRLLMVQRSDSGQWSLPGGYADVGLSGSEVAIKEVLEETGIEVRVNALLGEYDALRNPGQRIPLYSLLYHCTAIGGSLGRHEQETDAVGWFHRSEVPEPLWQEGKPWLELSLRAVEGVRQSPYFEPPR